MAGSHPLPAGLHRMTPRDPAEPHRAASPLELLFDLVFVVAVSFSSQELHHLLAEGHVADGIVSYLMLFFAVWWAWMNFTSFDTDDWLYRLTTIVQMAGALILAAGSHAAMQDHDFTAVTIGYVVMRLALVSQWLRAAAGSRELQGTALRYASGITVVQVAWLLRLLLPGTVGTIAFVVLVAAEVAVPIWAEAQRPTPWNPHHITERYSLFTLILLGESILASANSIVEAIGAGGHHLPALLTLAVVGLCLAAGMWWVYFSREQHQHIGELRHTLTFGYFHYVIFAAAGAFSAGIEVTVDALGGEVQLSAVAVAAALTVPVALFLLGVWWSTLRHALGAPGNALLLVGVAIVLAGTALGGLTAAIVAAAGVALAVVATELPAPMSSTA